MKFSTDSISQRAATGHKCSYDDEDAGFLISIDNLNSSLDSILYFSSRFKLLEKSLFKGLFNSA